VREWVEGWKAIAQPSRQQVGIRCQDIVHNPCIQDIVQFYVSCIQHIG